MTCRLFLAATLALFPLAARAQAVVVVEDGSATRYLANSTDPGLGLAWIQETFDDTAWSDGFYGIGYDSFGGLPRAEALILTTVPLTARSVYTRTTFGITDVNQIQNIQIGADRDDGWAAWINGVQVHCSPEMPTCSPDWNTAAALHESTNGPYPDYATLQDITAAALGALHNGDNVLAVGVWNAGLDNDLVLSPQLTLNLPSIAVTRGPYLQQVTDSSAIVRWRTAVASSSRVRYTETAGGSMQMVQDSTLTTEHELTLTGLAPDTEYEYLVGTKQEPLAGFDGRHEFRTAPVPGTRRPYRLWAVGDSGAANARAGNVRRAYEEVTGTAATDLWLMLGDNAYESGTESQYQKAVFETYPRLLRRAAVWSTFGNHDASSASSATTSGPYYDAFTLPTAAEAGGVVSGTEAYYSFDFGNMHFISLNSQDVDREPGSDMLLWLAQDLAQTTADWIIAFWHHPPYSKGSHDSDNIFDSGGRLVDMRENMLPILESWGVDLVLAGHSHVYERSFLLDGHYGFSSTLDPSMLLDAGDGRLDGDGSYEKASAGSAPHEGAVYVVAGSSSKLNVGSLDHPAMFFSLGALGSLVLEIEGDRLRGSFIDDDAQFRDRFTLVKNTAVLPVGDFIGSPLSGSLPLSVAFVDQSSTNTAGWSWDFDADALEDSRQIDPAHIYAEPGHYTVRLDVSNAAGMAFSEKSDYVCVSNGAVDRVEGLVFAGDRQTLSWAPFHGTATFDTIKGDLGVLRAGGFTGSVLACVENDDGDEIAGDTEQPPAGTGFYYLVRRGSCASAVGTYDSGGASQQGPRDAGIDASSQSCP